MPIIIDGWNLIRDERSPVDLDDAIASAQALVRILVSYQRAHRDPITVVFDSKRGHLELAHTNNEQLTAIPAKDADGYIMKFVANIPEKQRRNVRVVSSDNKVYYHAKSHYATPITSDEFWQTLTKKRGPR